ncbi:MAG: hypothetical protein HW401_52 [Parcubacteria group bacterium]|nr:hypothetical protein [Parcubacteria group bacterium]
MNIIAPIFLILASVGIFYGYTNPNYRGENVSASIVKLTDERKQYVELLTNADSLKAERNELLKKHNSISGNNLDRLKKLLPDHIDNVRLIIDIDGIASRYGLNIRNININNNTGNEGVLGPDNNPYGTLTLKFNIIAPYDKFRLFAKDLQESLRVIDIVGVSFNSTETGSYDYGITVKTYWIK